MIAVRVKPTWHAIGQIVAPLILFAASVAFVAGGVRGGPSVGGVVFVILGIVGILVFGTGVVILTGRLLARRPVLELAAEGVRRPAGWPRPRRADRVLPWPEVTGLCLVRRGLPHRRRGIQDYLIFLSTEDAAEQARAAAKPQLVALTLTDLPAGAQAAPWSFAVGQGWDVSLKQIAAEVRRHDVPLIDRRKS